MGKIEQGKIYKREFKKSLRGIRDLNREDRRYTSEVFKKTLRSGLNERELKREMYRLKRNTKDTLNRRELAKIERDLSRRIKR